jgi:D-alanyl-D-alanine carboxypeptidase
VLLLAAAPWVGSPLVTTVAADDGSAPACRHADVRTALSSYDDWAGTLLDTTYRLPASYAPPDLVPVVRAGLAGTGQVRRLVIPDLTELVRAARADGISLAAVSGYRSFQSQAGTFAHWVRVKGYPGALLGSARAGHSEHQLGTAVDFTSAPGVEPWYFSWFGSSTARWLARNAWRYGFVMSYPAGGTAVTCYHHEPWHYRYVGRATAVAVKASGETLREFLLRHDAADAEAPQGPGASPGSGPLAIGIPERLQSLNEPG